MSQEQNYSKKKISSNDENINNNEDSIINIIDEEEIIKNSKEKQVHYHHKEKTKNLKKINNDIEIISEKKIVKVKNLINDEYINEYNPNIQNNDINPKLKFFIDTESVSDSDRDLSSASLSRDSLNNNVQDDKQD